MTTASDGGRIPEWLTNTTKARPRTRASGLHTRRRRNALGTVPPHPWVKVDSYIILGNLRRVVARSAAGTSLPRCGISTSNAMGTIPTDSTAPSLRREGWDSALAGIAAEAAG
jgi:hypothetical protein